MYIYLQIYLSLFLNRNSKQSNANEIAIMGNLD